MAVDFNTVPSACFVLDEAELQHNVEILLHVKKESHAKILLALKGFAMYSAFPLIRNYLDGTTASSIYEARLGFEEFKKEVHGYAPAYLDKEFAAWTQHCSHISFNSIQQWNTFKAKVASSGNKISCGIRINPEYTEVETDLYNPCIAGSRLGMRREQLGDELPEGIEGIHFHTLCESNSFELQRTLEVIERRFGHLLHQCKWINMGGGHLITKEGYDIQLLIRLIKYMQETYQVEVILEPGSAIAWEAGFLTATVQDIFDSNGIKAAILDISVAAHMPDCIEMPYTPTVLGAEIVDEKSSKERYRLGGLTCLAGDFVGDYHFPNGLHIGDRVVFKDMMHYTMVKTHFFNGVNHPSIGIWRANNTFELIRTFDYLYYKNKLS